jgi:GH35 family endo-1,4-beta-xylanase
MPTPTVTATATRTIPPTDTPTPKPTETPRPPTLRDLAQRRGIKIGTTVDGAEDYKNAQYRSIVGRDFSLLMPAGTFMQSTFDKWGLGMATDFSQLAKDNNMTLRLQPLFWHQDVPANLKDASQKDIEAYMDKRIRTYLQFVQKGKQTQIDIVIEPFAWNKDKIRWEPQYITELAWSRFSKFG